MNKRVRAGVIQYRIKWQGYNSRDDTWEPADNITDWGGAEAILEYEQKHDNQVAMAALERELDEDERATLQLMRQHKCKGDMQDWKGAYKAELQGCLDPGPTQRLQEVFGEERERILKTQRVVRLRMNPEPKKAGRKKMRLLVRGDTQPASWTVGHTDSPVASSETLRMLLFGGDIGDEEETIATCDAVTAFRQSNNFGPEEEPTYVGYKPHKHAELRVMKLLGSLYGMVDASMRWLQTIVPWLLEQGFTQGANDQCIFTNAATGVRICLFVDDYLCRGTRAKLEIFFDKLCKAFEHKPPTYLEDTEDGLYFVGIHITQTLEDGLVWYHMDQQRDIDEFVRDICPCKLDMQDWKGAYKAEL